MRIANVGGRLTIVTDDGGIDVENASGGRFSADPSTVYDRWVEFREWVASLVDERPKPFDSKHLGAPSPRPRQIFSIGANYADHAEEADFELPKVMEVFSKFPTCITGPYADVPLPKEGSVDWEAELVVVIGRSARRVSREEAWDYVAGLTAGQDFSERVRQMAASQWGLAKSHPAFGPTGPWLVTTDDLENRDDLAITCKVNGEQVQHSRSSKLIYSVPEIIEEVSSVCTLLPGDLIFTGTMAGVGLTRKPPRYLAVGDVVTTEIAEIGELRNTMVGES